MIARIWHGWTKPENAEDYRRLLSAEILPGIHRVAGYRGAYLLSRSAGEENEFVTVTLWDSMESVRRFAGSDSAHAVVPESARRLLTRFDARSEHYDGDWIP